MVDTTIYIPGVVSNKSKAKKKKHLGWDRWVWGLFIGENKGEK